jgi:hypothetical protein
MYPFMSSKTPQKTVFFAMAVYTLQSADDCQLDGSTIRKKSTNNIMLILYRESVHYTFELMVKDGHRHRRNLQKYFD